MSIDDQIRQALDRAAQELTRVVADERSRAIAEATEAAAADVRQKAHQQLALIRDAAQKHTDELRRAADAQIADLQRALEDAGRRAQAEIEDARRTAQTQVDDVQRAMDQRIADLQGRLTDTERRLNDAVQDIERVRTSAAAEALDQARAGSRQAEQEHTIRLLNAIRRLDDASSLGEVLDGLAQAAAGEAERAAVMVARGERLVGWSLRGFGEHAPNPRHISLDLDDAGLPGIVVRSGAAASRRNTGLDLPAFARDAGSRDALALPVIVGGTPVAVLYADVLSSDGRAGDRWLAALDVLTRHASKVLEALTVQQAVGLSMARPLARPSHDVVAGPGHDRGA